jgi:hypothetical protein
MLSYQIALMLHVLLAIYWIGSDVAVYYISGAMTNRSHSSQVRLFAGKTMLALDMIPRTCLPLILASGFCLAQATGLLTLSMPAVVLWLIAAGAAAWLALTWAVHHMGGKGIGVLLARIDFAFRMLVIICIVALVIASTHGLGPVADAMYLQAKLLIFALITCLGLVIRVQLKPMSGLFAAVATGKASDAEEAALAQLLSRVKGVVWLIWALLWISVWLGLHKSWPWQ